MQIVATLIGKVDWRTVIIVFGSLWSVFWSFAPTPLPNTWYSAVFHTAQYISMNPGRSIAIVRNNGNHVNQRTVFQVGPKT